MAINKRSVADHSSFDVVILAAGYGRRMCSTRPKVLHEIAGKSMLRHVVELVEKLAPNHIYVVYGNGGQTVPSSLADLPISWIQQKEILGTGHAVTQVLPVIDNDEKHILILLGDTPFVSTDCLKSLLAQTQAHEIGLITLKTSQPFGLGRILRNEQGHVVHIIEEKEASAEQKKITEINSGIFYVPLKLLKRWLPKLQNKNTQAEYYLTDIIALAASEQVPITTVLTDNEHEMQGINDKVQLAKAERFYQRSQAEQLMLAGVTLSDPNRFDLRGKLQVGTDVTIDINVIIEGNTTVGDRCTIGPNSLLKNVTLGSDVQINGYCVIEDAIIADGCVIGPFARIRPGTQLNQQVSIGNFVEIKNSCIDSATKINHLSYIGDATIGKQVNIGAGTITCNYDGATKHHTTIEDDVFIGSNSALIAPIHIGAQATVGAGSTLSKPVAAKSLTLNRAATRRIHSWQRPQKKTD